MYIYTYIYIYIYIYDIHQILYIRVYSFYILKHDIDIDILFG